MTIDSILTWIRVNIVSWLIPPKPVKVIDIIQVLLIAFLIYRLIMWMKTTRSYTLLKGILFVIAFIVVANIFNMDVIVWLLNNLGVVAVTAIIIIFQPELRRVLEQVGHTDFFRRLFSIGSKDTEGDKRFSDHTLNQLVHACFDMGEVKTGALIVIQCNESLREYENTGIRVDAEVSSELLINIFEHNTPLHDGAVIIRDDRVAAATCYLPLSGNMGLSKTLGTRHRAGMGISEVTDSFTIIVSEETGKVSYAQGGSLTTGVSMTELREQMTRIQKYRRSGR